MAVSVTWTTVRIGPFEVLELIWRGRGAFVDPISTFRQGVSKHPHAHAWTMGT
jgi:hypothetical protein